MISRTNEIAITVRSENMEHVSRAKKQLELAKAEEREFDDLVKKGKATKTVIPILNGVAIHYHRK